MLDFQHLKKEFSKTLLLKNRHSQKTVGQICVKLYIAFLVETLK